MLSSESSIETLPDFTQNGLIIERTVINDQTIANYCSDTVRELNNLTEELHHTDLHMGRFNNDRNRENGFGATNKPCERINACGPNDDLTNEHRRTLQEITNNHSINNLSQMNSNRVYESNCNGRIGGHIDAVDSSPFYTQLSQHLENNLSNFIEDGKRRSGSCDRSSTPGDSVDGRMDNGGLGDDGDEFVSCMLQSVDLRGKMLRKTAPFSFCFNLNEFCSPFADTSPIHSSLAFDAQSLWHGNIETSTDTLVPVIESTPCGNGLCLDATSKLYSTVSLVDDADSNSCDAQRINDTRSRVTPSASETPIVARPMKSVWSNGGPTYMDESILMQPEHQRMDIVNGGSRPDNATTMNGTGVHVPLHHRRRRNSSNSKQPTVDVISPNGQLPNRLITDNLSPTTVTAAAMSTNASNTRFGLSSARTMPTTPPGLRSFNATTLSTLPPTPAVISCPDGLAHALSEQNLRLQQIVHDHKVNHPLSYNP